MVVDNFKLCREGGDFYFINPKVTNFLKDIIAPDPTLIEEKCIGCNRCAEVCPEKPYVIDMIKKRVKNTSLEYEKCIRCFCCQELCPKGAIETKYSFIGRFLNRDGR